MELASTRRQDWTFDIKASMIWIHPVWPNVDWHLSSPPRLIIEAAKVLFRLGDKIQVGLGNVAAAPVRLVGPLGGLSMRSMTRSEEALLVDTTITENFQCNGQTISDSYAGSRTLETSMNPRFVLTRRIIWYRRPHR
jgi:hypothetical protein